MTEFELQEHFKSMNGVMLKQIASELAQYALETKKEIALAKARLEALETLEAQAWREHGYAAMELNRRDGL